MYTVKDLINDLNDFPMDAEVKPLEFEVDKEDGISLFEIHLKEDATMEVTSEQADYIATSKIWIITTD